MPPAIVVDGLSKSYLLRHRREAPAYRTLRESLSEGAARIVRALGRGSVPATDSRETFWALRDVSFSVEEGERLAVIGRNGAGKSTLLKLLSRITSPTEGAIRIRGRLSSLLEVGTGFHPELTGRENIFLSGAVHGMSQLEVRKKFDDIVSFAEVERFLDTPVKRYSSGMYVRLAFAVSAFLQPDIILLDEVLAVGDAAFQRKCQAKMKELASQGRTVLFVSHSMAAVKVLCGTGLVLSGGRASSKMPVEEAIAVYSQEGFRSDDLEFPLSTDEVDCITVDLMQGGGHSAELEGGLPIDVLIRLGVKKPLTEFRIGFYLKTALGDHITRALMDDWHPETATIEPGRHDFHARIPAHFLAAGNYRFELHCSRFGIRDYFADSVSIPVRVRRSLAYGPLYPAEAPHGPVLLNPGWTRQRIYP